MKKIIETIYCVTGSIMIGYVANQLGISLKTMLYVLKYVLLEHLI